MVANGEPARVLALVDPDSDLADGGRGAPAARSCSCCRGPHRDLAEAFAGTAPAPGGPFRTATFEDIALGSAARRRDQPGPERRWRPRPSVGWSTLLTLAVDEVSVGDDDEPLVHRRGRYVRPRGSGERRPRRTCAASGSTTRPRPRSTRSSCCTAATSSGCPTRTSASCSAGRRRSTRSRRWSGSASWPGGLLLPPERRASSWCCATSAST